MCSWTAGELGKHFLLATEEGKALCWMFQRNTREKTCTAFCQKLFRPLLKPFEMLCNMYTIKYDTAFAVIFPKQTNFELSDPKVMFSERMNHLLEQNS